MANLDELVELRFYGSSTVVGTGAQRTTTDRRGPFFTQRVWARALAERTESTYIGGGFSDLVERRSFELRHNQTIFDSVINSVILMRDPDRDNGVVADADEAQRLNGYRSSGASETRPPLSVGDPRPRGGKAYLLGESEEVSDDRLANLIVSGEELERDGREGILNPRP